LLTQLRNDIGLIAESAPKMVAEKQRGRIFRRPRGTQDAALGLGMGTYDAPTPHPSRLGASPLCVGAGFFGLRRACEACV
jgi:hypothetical protein